MTVTSKVSTCVDCATTFIGERLRCPACHDLHAPRVVTAHQGDATDDAVTAPRPRQRVHVANRTRGWIVAVEVLGMATLALILLVKGCS